MARLMLRLLGLGLLAVAIAVPGCQALFPRDAATSDAPHIVRDGQGP
jgi:hypothetical protein